MSTFRQLLAVAIISFGAAVGVVSQIPYFDVKSTLGAVWSALTNETILPLTVGMTLIVGLLILWNPEQ